MKLGRHEVPDLWQKMLPEDFQWLRTPDEKLATCHDCHNVAIGEAKAGCQCCTYYPTIPNFMLGAALQDPRSREVVLDVIARGHGLPSGLLPTAAVYGRAVSALAEDRFGMEPDMVCPFMHPSTGDCGVYGYRNSVCSTFFCSHDHDEAGAAYWNKMQDLIGMVETSLSQWAMDQMSMPARGFFDRLDGWAEKLSEAEADTSARPGWSEEARRDLWGEWFGREAEFYEGCAELAKAQDTELYDRAREQKVWEPLLYDRAVRAAVADDARMYAPYVPEEQNTDEGRVENLWYRLQLSARQLWSLPFNEGAIGLAEGVRIEDAKTRLRLYGEAPVLVTLGDEALGVSEAEAKALRVFETPQPLSEDVMERAELLGLEDSRASLSHWMRRGLLVKVPTSAE